MPPGRPLRCATSAARTPRAWFDSPTARRIVVVLIIARARRGAAQPDLRHAVPAVLSHTLVVGATLLLAYTAAGLWRQTWLPRWLAQVLVALVAPLATFVVYLFVVGGDVSELIGHEGGLSLRADLADRARSRHRRRARRVVP